MYRARWKKNYGSGRVAFISKPTDCSKGRSYRVEPPPYFTLTGCGCPIFFWRISVNEISRNSLHAWGLTPSTITTLLLWHSVRHLDSILLPRSRSLNMWTPSEFNHGRSRSRYTGMVSKTFNGLQLLKICVFHYDECSCKNVRFI